MSDHQPLSIPVPTDKPRHAQQEIADLLATALLRLRSCHTTQAGPESASVGLGFSGHQSVNGNPAPHHGVRP